MLSYLCELITSNKVTRLSYLIQLHQISSMAACDGGHIDSALKNRLTVATESICHILSGDSDVLWV